jgi:tetratricopeptide (TPR) repeat protein
LGALYSNLGRYELAAQHLERALKLQPDDPATLFETGLVHARQEELSDARGFFERALEGRPDNAETHFRLAEIHHYESEVDEAERYYLEAIELDSGYAVAYFHLGRLYAGASRARESEAPLLRALELDAGLSEAHHELARVYDQLDKAQAHFESALELAPFAPAPRLNFANFLLRRSAPEKGRAQLLEFRKLKEAENRIKELKAAINFDPTNASYKRELVE